MLVKNIRIDASQEELLAEISESIIPKTETPGAKDVYAHLFVLKMMDDCRTKEDQDKFVKGLRSFEKYLKEKTSTSFVKLSPEKRLSILKALDKREAQDDLQYFYRSMKGLTIQAYTTSQFYLTKVKVYELVPGRWHGCFPLKAESQLN